MFHPTFGAAALLAAEIRSNGAASYADYNVDNDASEALVDAMASQSLDLNDSTAGALVVTLADALLGRG